MTGEENGPDLEEKGATPTSVKKQKNRYLTLHFLAFPRLPVVL